MKPRVYASALRIQNILCYTNIHSHKGAHILNLILVVRRSHCSQTSTSWRRICHHLRESELQLSGVGLGWPHAARPRVSPSLGSRVPPWLLVVRESSAGPTHEPRPARLSLRTAGWAGGKRREGQATALSPMVTGFRAGCAERFAGQAPLRRPQPWVASAGVALDSPLPRPAATAMPRWDQPRVALAPRRGPHTWGASLTPFLICPRSPALQAGNEAPPAAP